MGRRYCHSQAQGPFSSAAQGSLSLGARRSPRLISGNTPSLLKEFGWGKFLRSWRKSTSRQSDWRRSRSGNGRPSRFEVRMSQPATRLLRQRQGEASQAGTAAEFLDALRVIWARLQNDPTTFGEPHYCLPARAAGQCPAHQARARPQDRQEGCRLDCAVVAMRSWPCALPGPVPPPMTMAASAARAMRAVLPSFALVERTRSSGVAAAWVTIRPQQRRYKTAATPPRKPGRAKIAKPPVTFSPRLTG